MRSPWDPETTFPRLGNLYEVENPGKPAVPALLHLDHTGLRIEVPFTPASHEDEGRWFNDGTECPDRLLFQDHQLDLHLFGVYVSTQRRDPRYAPGLGELRAEFAVEDRDRTDVEYVEVAATRSEIDGLHEFMGWTLAEFNFDRKMDGDDKQTYLRLVPKAAVRLGVIDGLEVKLSPAWWAGTDRPNVKAVAETTVLETRAIEPRALEDHIRIHQAIRDLLAVLCWQPIDFMSVEVQREDAPALSLEATPLAAAWRTIHGPHLRRRQASEPRPDISWIDVRDPVSYVSLGSDALRVWLLRGATLSRVVDPLLTLRYLPSSADVALMQTSIAAEALGYVLARRAGASARSAKDETFTERLQRVVAGQPLDVEAIVGRQDQWIKAAATAYNGVKHANRKLPEPPMPTLLALTILMLLRSHLLIELGVAEEAVAKLSEKQSWWGLQQAYESATGWVT